MIIYGQGRYIPGYIITNDSDTLKGLIKAKSNYLNSKSCDFIYGNEKIPKHYSPSDIKAYRIENGNYYISKDVTIDSLKQKVFLEYLVKGIVDLYYLKDSQKEIYFLEKDNQMIPLSNDASIVTISSNDGSEKNYEKKSNQYKSVLTYLFQNSPSTTEKIPNTNFTYKSLIAITIDYHNATCHDRKCIDFTKSTKQHMFIEPYFGVINSWMGLATSKDLVYRTNLYAGLQLRFIPFKSNIRWNFLVGINYSTNNFLGDFNNSLYSADYIETYRIHSQYTIIRVPLIFEYSLTETKIQPFISLGYNNVFLLNPSWSALRVDRGDNYNVSGSFEKYQFGFSAGLGLKCNLNATKYFFMKSDIEYRIPSVNSGNTLDYQKICSLLINAGFGFKIK